MLLCVPSASLPALRFSQKDFVSPADEDYVGNDVID